MSDTNDQQLILTLYDIRNTVYDFCHCEHYDFVKHFFRWQKM